MFSQRVQRILPASSFPASLLPGSRWGISFPALHFWRNQEVPAVRKLWLFQSEQMYLLVPERKSIMFLKQCFTRSFNHTLSYLHSCFVSKSGDVGSFTYSFGPTSCFPLFPTSGREYSTLGSNSSIHSSEVCFVSPCQAHLHPRSPPTLVPCTSHILTPGFLHSCCFSLPEFCQQSQLLHVFWLTVTKPQFQSQSPFVDSQSFLCYLFPCFQTQLFCPDFFSSSSASAHSPTLFLILH